MAHPHHSCGILRASVLLATAGILVPTARAQGALSPPGAPEPTMKTLTQVEPRTPLETGAAGVTRNPNGGYTIHATGSYYLTADLAVATDHAVLIGADDVTLDLNGFSIRSAATGVIGAAILASYGRDRLTIRNGSIHGQGTVDVGTAPDTYGDLGFSAGISASTSEQVLVEGIHVSATQSGIYLGQGSGVARHCTVSRISGSGIVAAHVESCVARLIGGNAITAQLAVNCTGESQTGDGVLAQQAATCRGFSQSGTGVRSLQVADCYGQSSSGPGIVTLTALNSIGASTDGDGLIATTAASCIGTTIQGAGITSDGAVSESYGHTINGFAGIDGRQVTNSKGVNETGTYGLRASLSAFHCFGQNYNGAGFGLEGNAMAVFCRGVNYGGGHGLWTQTAIGCTYFGAFTAGQRYLMP